MIDPGQSKRPVSIWEEALDPIIPCGEDPYGYEHFALEISFSVVLADRRFNELRDFLDPKVPHAGITGEPGWYLSRQLRKGELFEQYEYYWKLRQSKRHTFRPYSPDAGPDPDWPKWARFCASLIDPEEFGDPSHPVRYYDAATFQDFLSRMLTVYMRRNSEVSVPIEQIRASLAYWVERDAQSHPGDG